MAFTAMHVLFLPLLASALKINVDPESNPSSGMALSCSDEPHWGIWTDGRHASGGEAYGEAFGTECRTTLKAVYERAKKQGTAADNDLFEMIAKLFGEKPMASDTPHKSVAIHTCMTKALTKEERAAVMEDVIVWKKDGNNSLSFSKEYTVKGNRGQHTRMIFEEYNKKQRSALGRHEKLKALAFLMHNLALDHRLQDHNGRQRVFILQYELRRLNLACGTFLYNNNRDMPYNTNEQTVGKIEEGIAMYNKWQQSKVNPWTEKNVKKHLAAFPRTKTLIGCWHKEGQMMPCHHEGCNHKDTSIE